MSKLIFNKDHSPIDSLRKHLSDLNIQYTVIGNTKKLYCIMISDELPKEELTILNLKFKDTRFID